MLVAAMLGGCLFWPGVLGASDESVVDLPDMDIAGSAADQEYWPEEAADMFPFRRSGVFAAMLADEAADREDYALLNEQLGALGDFRPAEFVMTSGAGAPRGFTTPRLRNGLSQSGFPEIILGGRRELLTGFLATYHGRTAPGGILNHVSIRPAPRPRSQGSVRISSLREMAVSAERHAPLVPKRLHYRATADVFGREGPEDFARQKSARAGLGLRLSPRKTTVWLFELEAAWADAHPSGGLPVVRVTRGARSGGPHAPLATFNTNGPGAWSRRASGSMSTLVEHQLQPGLTLRGGGEVWARRQDDLRFNTGAYLLDQGVFDGVREPQFNGRDHWAAGCQLELDGTGRLSWTDHRWVAGVFVAREQAGRDQRALPREVRDQLPAGVRVLDPGDPDFRVVPYSEDVYTRLIASRQEGSDLFGVYLTERLALARDRVHATFGLRLDRVAAWVDDLRPGATTPHAESEVGRTTGHAGAIWHTVPNRLASFINYSTAFQPARRVDARTGRIIGNEGTMGIETGLRLALADGRSSVTWSAYRLWNENITRNNPHYNDPVLDPDQRQPQFVSSGEERFTGAELGVRFRAAEGVTVAAKAGWLDAVTTQSPDLPEEVGRQLSRVPGFTAAGSIDYIPAPKRLGGLRVSASYAWVGPHVAIYEDRRREQVEYDGYGVVGLRGSIGWKVKKSEQSLSLSVRNAFDLDLVEAAGRVGGERSIDATLGVRF